MAERRAKLTASVTGLHFAALQVGAFLSVESVSSSAWATYAALSAAWLGGTLAGLWLTLPAGPTVLAGVVAFEGLVAYTRLAPWSRGLFAFAAAAAAIGGLWAGAFFTRAARRRATDGVFLHENNGFLVGLVATPVTFAFGGRTALAALPVVTCAMLFVLDQTSPRTRRQTP
ncbi:MAG: hypothetical protein KF850_42490 [Labilithrix sp.]|nr:hypothetical protein [Labilithrix sp.]MBX3218751.1 hypothetical protein [Labilithrix sp.]